MGGRGHKDMAGTGAQTERVTNKDLPIKGRINSTSTRRLLASACDSAFLLAPALCLGFPKGSVKPELRHVQ